LTLWIEKVVASGIFHLLIDINSVVSWST